MIIFLDAIALYQNIQVFKKVFENESRIIFSAKFGDDKSYFLNEFMKSYDEMDNDYYFITLHPVNYVVEENRDVIEYIKRDKEIIADMLKSLFGEFGRLHRFSMDSKRIRIMQE